MQLPDKISNTAPTRDLCLAAISTALIVLTARGDQPGATTTASCLVALALCSVLLVAFAGSGSHCRETGEHAVVAGLRLAASLSPTFSFAARPTDWRSQASEILPEGERHAR